MESTTGLSFILADGQGYLLIRGQHASVCRLTL